MMRPLLRGGLFAAAALAGCLPEYDNHYMAVSTPDMASTLDSGSGGMEGGTLGEGGAGGDMGDPLACMPSGMDVTGHVFSWGPNPGQAGYRSGIIGNILGSPCLSGKPTDVDGNFDIPIPQSAIGKSSFFQFHGATPDANGNMVPIFNMLSGPLLFDGGADNHFITRHVVLNQKDGIRDTISKELGVDLSDETKYAWIYGAFVDAQNVYTNATVTVMSPPEAVANCKVYYTCEFNLGGPCGQPGLTFIQQKDNYGNYLVVCDKQKVSGWITLTATGGINPNDQTSVSFPPQTVPVSLPGQQFDMVFSDWPPM